MRAKYLLDSNTLSEPVKPLPNPGVVERILAHQSEIATAAPAWQEMVYGCFRLPQSRRRANLERYLFQYLAPELMIFPYEQSAADWHASERARLSNIGLTPPFADGRIAAVAYVNGPVPTTANTADFLNFRGLRVEDWSR